MTKDRVIPTPTTIDVVSDEAKEERKEREPEATFESAETTFPDKSRDADDASIAKDDATEDGAKEEARKKSNENDGKEEEFTIDPEVIADEAATLKFSVRHEKELNDLLREKEIDDDDTVEQAILERPGFRLDIDGTDFQSGVISKIAKARDVAVQRDDRMSASEEHPRMASAAAGKVKHGPFCRHQGPKPGDPRIGCHIFRGLRNVAHVIS